MKQQTIKAFTAFALAAGLAFSATHPAAAVQAFSVVTCSLATPTPCVGGTNTNTGPGVQGISSLGFGNVGQTKFNSTSTTNAKAGILGQDLSTSGTNDEGVRGTSTRGLGVHGISSSRSGVRGDATSAQGVFGNSSSNAGVEGISATNTGVIGESSSTHAGGDGGGFIAIGTGNGLSATASQTGTGVSAFSNQGTGVEASGQTEGVSANGRFAVEGTNANVSGAVDIYANGIGGSEYLFVGNNSHGANVFTVDDAGNVHAHSFTADLAASSTRNGSTISTYSSQVRTPTIEDFGEGRLVGGTAYVPLKASFGPSIDRSQPYLVFITAQGTTRGPVNVIQKDARGFTVREIGGTSSVAFDYRIVAKPYLAAGPAAAVKPLAASKTLPVRKVFQPKYRPN